MISICIQCVCNVYLKSYQALEANTSQISTKQWTIKVVPDQLNVKTMILICIQCVFNVFSMCIQDHINLWKLIIVQFQQIIMVVPTKLNVKNMISICIQCVFIVFLRSYQALEANTSQISTRQWTTQVVPDQLNVKTMILIFFQCVFNVFSMCIQDHIKLWKLKIVRF